MKLGLALLGAAYVLSQFYRACLAVLSTDLQRDLGATPEDLAFASGIWFLIFALMQIPVGEALDRIGPRKTATVLFTLGGAGGAALFAVASTPLHVAIAMGLIGVGCSPVLMASYFIFARMYPAKVFATLAATMIGVGTLGNIASASPLTWVVGEIGWRNSLWALTVVSLVIAAGIALFVKDPPRADGAAGGSVLAVLRIRALWPILPLLAVNYAPAAGLRGLWVGPYLSDVYGATPQVIGTATLIMGAAMIVSTFAYGPLDRLIGTRKWVIFIGNFLGLAGCVVLAAQPEAGFGLSVALCASVAMLGMSFPVMIAHGRSFLPVHLTGRGVTLMNLMAIGGVGLVQLVSGKIYAGVATGAATVVEPYQAVFVFFAALLLVGLVPYLFSRDSLD